MDIESIRKEITPYKKKHSLDQLEPLRGSLKEGHKKGMTLTALCEVVRKHSTLKPSPSSLRDWLGLPKPAPIKKKEPAPNSSALNQNGSS